MKEKLISVKLHELVEDFKLLPRPQVDSQNVGVIRSAIAAGYVMPPIVIDAKSKRIVDGFHRKRAYEEEFGIDYEIEVLARDYPDEASMYRDACERNTTHGRNLTSYDRAYAALRAKTLYRMKIEHIAASLHMSVDGVKSLLSRKSARTATASGIGIVPVKRTVSHMAGKVLTKKQVAEMPHLSGQLPLREVNELIRLIESDMWDVGNPSLMERAQVFCDLFLALKKGLRKSA